jgi:hypothetical protein
MEWGRRSRADTASGGEKTVEMPAVRSVQFVSSISSVSQIEAFGTETYD